MIDEAKRWETILAQTCTVSGEQGTVTMTMTELLEWLESERGFLRREAAAAFLSQFQRATVHRNESRYQFAKNHNCGMNCDSCGEYGCDSCSSCPELKKGGFCCGNYPEVCDRTPDEIVEYAEALADWIYEFRRERAER